MLYFYNNFLLLLIVNVDEVGFICNTKIHSFPFVLFFSFPICYDSFVISENKFFIDSVVNKENISTWSSFKSSKYTSLCSKKKFSEPSALKLWNPRAHHMLFMRKVKFVSRPSANMRCQGPAPELLEHSPHTVDHLNLKCLSKHHAEWMP